MRLRRSASGDAKLELTPLIDVVFLLLTYFIFSMILMTRADVLDVRLPTLGAAGQIDPGVAITVALTSDGSLAVNGDAVDLAGVAARITELREAEPDARVLLAVDVNGTAGDMLRVTDALLAAGISDFSVLAQPGGAESQPRTPAAPPTEAP